MALIRKPTKGETTRMKKAKQDSSFKHRLRQEFNKQGKKAEGMMGAGISKAAKAAPKVFSKIRTIQRADAKIMNAGKNAKLPTQAQVSKAIMRDLKKSGSVSEETNMMKQALKTGKEPTFKDGLLIGFTRHQSKEFLKQHPFPGKFKK